MHGAFRNGLFDTRWENAPPGPGAIRLVRKLRPAALRAFVRPSLSLPARHDAVA